MNTLDQLGYPMRTTALLVAAEGTGAVGLIMGLLWWALGVVASVVLNAYLIGATRRSWWRYCCASTSTCVCGRGKS
jgi:hypothetical protein